MGKSILERKIERNNAALETAVTGVLYVMFLPVRLVILMIEKIRDRNS